VLPDLLVPGLALVVCGTAAGTRSAAVGHYYAGPGNKFWATLAATGLTPRRLAPAEGALLPSFGIGLTDVVKAQSGGDADLVFRRSDRATLRDKIERFAPAILCFNGKRAGHAVLGRGAVRYGLQAERIAATRLFVAPSTSGAANGYWDVAVWHELARLVTSGR
jgi:TDG/mug DNA glycosylase family protein